MRAVEQLRSEELQRAGGTIIPDLLVGTWHNTNAATLGITKLLLGSRNGRIFVHIFAAGDSSPIDWGETDASLFSSDPHSTEATAFSAFYDFDFMDTRLQAHLRQGVLIVAKFDRFKDSSGRSNYFSKEFFYRAKD